MSISSSLTSSATSSRTAFYPFSFWSEVVATERLNKQINVHAKWVKIWKKEVAPDSISVLQYSSGWEARALQRRYEIHILTIAEVKSEESGLNLSTSTMTFITIVITMSVMFDEQLISVSSSTTGGVVSVPSTVASATSAPLNQKKLLINKNHAATVKRRVYTTSVPCFQDSSLLSELIRKSLKL